MSIKKSYFTTFLGVPDRIRKIRGNLTQEEFGSLIGVTQGTVQKYEKGDCLPSEKVQKKIADYGRVTVEWLLHGEAPAPSIREHAPETYDARPAALNIDYLIRANFLARRFIKAHRLAFTDLQEAELSSYLYEYLTEHHADPCEVVVNRFAVLIHGQKQEG